MSIDSKPIITIDVIAAVRNEEEGIHEFVSNIRRLNRLGVKIHIILVEDGSTDNTVAVIKEMVRSADDISFYSLMNPYGQGLALAYGMLESKADASLTIDADGSHPYEIAGQMIDRFLNGAEIVQGNRIAYDRKTIYRKFGSKLYFFLFTILTGINLYKQNVHFRLMNKDAINRFKKNNKGWYSMRIKHSGKKTLKIDYIDFTAPERIVGNSNFNFQKLFHFAYRSFLTLTGVGSFIMLNVLITPVLYLAYLMHPYLFLVLAILVLCNIVFYIKQNTVNYLARIKLLEAHKANVTPM